MAEDMDMLGKTYAQKYKELAGGNVGEQYLSKMALQKEQGSWLDKAAESLAGIPDAMARGYETGEKDFLANLARESYEKGGTGKQQLTRMEQGRRDALRKSQMDKAQLASEGLQAKSVAEMAKAKSAETKIGFGMESEKNLEALSKLQPVAESWIERYDSWWNADEDGLFDSAVKFAQSLPPQMRAQFMDMYIMPTYARWGGKKANPFSGEVGQGYAYA